MLAGIGILAVLGGALAFKPKNTLGSVLYTTSSTNFTTTVGACDVKLINSIVQPDPSGTECLYYTINGTTKDFAPTCVYIAVQN